MDDTIVAYLVGCIFGDLNLKKWRGGKGRVTCIELNTRTTRLDTLEWLLSVLTKINRVRVYYCRTDNSIRVQVYLPKEWATRVNDIRKFEIPHFVVNGSKEVVSSFIAGLFDSDGTIQIYKKTDAPTSIVNIRIVSTRKEFLQNLRELMLSKLNIETNIEGERTSTMFIGKPSYRLKVLGGHEGWLTFASYVYPYSYHPIKKRRLGLALKLAQNDWRFDTIREEYEETKRAILSSRKLSIEKVGQIVKRYSDKVLFKIIGG
ncbi:MAG: hypothetical protein DRO39_05375 [Thermoprotei archaeon]|nr:MAG: hypothetical protein DRO39_05375 [Thermoprotei archaeon]